MIQDLLKQIVRIDARPPAIGRFEVFRIGAFEFRAELAVMRREIVGTVECCFCKEFTGIPGTPEGRGLDSATQRAYDVAEAHLRHHWRWPPSPTASGFASFVFAHDHGRSLAHRTATSAGLEEGDLRAGRQAHLDIEELGLWLKKAGELPPARWTLRFRDEGDSGGEVFSSSELMVSGEALRCRPDLVFEDRSANLVLIVERKTTHVPCARIPEGGYLNNLAQLWCYSWIDEWCDASEVVLVCEYWNRPRGGNGGLERCPRKAVWRRSDRDRQRMVVHFFNLYGGEVGKRVSAMLEGE